MSADIVLDAGDIGLNKSGKILALLYVFPFSLWEKGDKAGAIGSRDSKEMHASG